MANKEHRKTVFLSPSVNAWVDAQCAVTEENPGAFIRRVLAERMNGLVAVRQQSATAPLSASDNILPSDLIAVGEAHVDPAQFTGLDPDAPIDIDALVDAQVEEAEEQGLASPQPQDDDLMPAAGVKALRRPAPPFSRLPGWLGQ